MKENMIFKQLIDYDTSTYTYLLADKNTKEAILIDPVKKQVERDYNLLQELGLKLKYILDTHIHADHVTGSYDLRERTGAEIVLGKDTNLECADILIGNGETLYFGDIEIKVISTPGHTDGCTTYAIDNMLFTGDTLLIRGSGRTDFQQGDSNKLYESIQKIFKYDDETIVYPGHDYNGFTSTTVGEEKKYNKFAKSSNSKESFVKIRQDSNPGEKPRYIHIALPSNLICGREVIEE